MRVALAIQHFPPYRGGAERQALALARRLAELTERCDVITSRHEPGLPRVTHEGAARVVRLPTAGDAVVRRALNGVMAFGYFLLRGGRYDVVHAHCLSPFALGAVLGARLRGARTVLKVCTLGTRGDIAKVRRGRLGSWLWRGFAGVDRWIATSPAAHDETLAHVSAPGRVVLVPNAVAIEPVPECRGPHTAAQARRDLGLPDAETCLFVGRLVPGKGLDAIAEAWPAIHATTGATLVIVGDGPLCAQLRKWAESPARRGSVRIIGWQASPSPYYLASDVLLFPSASEAFGNVLAEAMAHGLAVVTTPVGLAARWARHRDNAWVVAGGTDRAALSDAIRQAACELLADPALRLALGERARATALASFGRDAVVKAYLDVYRTIALDPRPRGMSRQPDAAPPTETDHA